MVVQGNGIGRLCLGIKLGAEPSILADDLASRLDDLLLPAGFLVNVLLNQAPHLHHHFIFTLASWWAVQGGLWI